MAKILIIEDSEIQRNWAKEELKDHEVKFLEYFSEYKIKELVNTGNFDLILTDLIIPDLEYDRSISVPDPYIGKKCFDEILRLYAEGVVKGIAVVSNFEHHLDEDATLSVKLIDDWFSSLSIVSKIVGWDKKNQTNVVIWVDYPVSQYEYFMADNTVESIKKNGISEVYDLRKDKKWNKITLLKPWKKIVSTLLS